ncbi:UDP-glucose 4-epimerase GalE [Idiomarina sp.]|uniref:UDP-glucose 4-epimerase GalE n=1 Tax=Idiomarina sp. TaxID=1874361 RepID=UPI002615F5D4|nr:UDP-glucose 4-epimerase GalE [Idiomarina sp.]
MSQILVTGGAGYIGSHTVVELLTAGHQVVVLDNLVNSSALSLERLEKITGKRPVFVKGDIRDTAKVEHLLSLHNIDSVIHFAGLKAVAESVVQPLEYYDTNFSGTVSLCKAMSKAGVKSIIFSSSATVYGTEAPVPYVESMPRGSTSNPYGESKAMVERMLTDLTLADPEWSVSLLRYFNPIGAHPSGLIGEDPKGVPNNLLPFITQVAIGRRDSLFVFGNDYPTEDGTCERDYLHVVDLARGHQVVAEKCSQMPGVHIYNLGTGQPVSVLNMIKTFEKVNKVSVPFRFESRRQGDLAAFWADTTKIRQNLNWTAKFSLDDMVKDAWRWQSQNPDGYRT